MYFNNQLTLLTIYLTLWYKMSLQKSLHSRYTIRGNNLGLKLKKAPKQFVLKLFKWAQMDLNHRPSDYESDALTN